jgi:copper(I)-binding protein
MTPFLALIPLLLATTFANVPNDKTLGDVTADHGLIYYTPLAGATEAFMDIHNIGPTPDTLAEVNCPIGDTTTMVGPDGKPIKTLTIPANKTVSLTAKGPHLALTSVHFLITYGSVIPCELTFASTGQIQILLYALPLPNESKKS